MSEEKIPYKNNVSKGNDLDGWLNRFTKMTTGASSTKIPFAPKNSKSLDEIYESEFNKNPREFLYRLGKEHKLPLNYMNGQYQRESTYGERFGKDNEGSHFNVTLLAARDVAKERPEFKEIVDQFDDKKEWVRYMQKHPGTESVLAAHYNRLNKNMKDEDGEIIKGDLSGFNPGDSRYFSMVLDDAERFNQKDIEEGINSGTPNPNILSVFQKHMVKAQKEGRLDAEEGIPQNVDRRVLENALPTDSIMHQAIMEQQRASQQLDMQKAEEAAKTPIQQKQESADTSDQQALSGSEYLRSLRQQANAPQEEPGFLDKYGAIVAGLGGMLGGALFGGRAGAGEGGKASLDTFEKFKRLSNEEQKMAHQKNTEQMQMARLLNQENNMANVQNRFDWRKNHTENVSDVQKAQQLNTYKQVAETRQNQFELNQEKAESLSDKQIGKFMSSKTALEQLNNVEENLNKAKVGFIAGRYGNVKAKLFGDKEQAALNTSLDLLVNSFAAAHYSDATTNAKLAEIRQAMSDPYTSRETALSKLHEMRKALSGAILNNLSTTEKGQPLKAETMKSIRKDIESMMPQSYLKYMKDMERMKELEAKKGL